MNKHIIDLSESIDMAVDKTSNDFLTEFNKDTGIIVSINIARSFITTCFLFLGSLWSTRAIMKNESAVDKAMTKKLRDVTGDEKIVVRFIDIDDVNAFNIGQNILYYLGGLKKMMNEDEIVAILLHEYGHYKGKHMQKQFVISGIAPWVLAATITSLITVQVGKEGKALAMHPCLMILDFMLNILYGSTVGREVHLYLGRKWEYFADSYAVKYGYGSAMASALKKIDKYMRKMICEGLRQEECDRIFKDMASIDEHPETKDRIEKVLEKLKSMVSKGANGLATAVTFAKRLKIKLKRETGNPLKCISLKIMWKKFLLVKDSLPTLRYHLKRISSINLVSSLEKGLKRDKKLLRNLRKQD